MGIIVYTLGTLFILFSIGVLVTVIFFGGTEILPYKILEKEGYEVKFSFIEGCDLLINNLDGSSSWVPCTLDEITLNNFAVKK